MDSWSHDSNNDRRILALTQVRSRSASSELRLNEWTEHDFAAVGGQFTEQKESYPHHLVLGKSEIFEESFRELDGSQCTKASESTAVDGVFAKPVPERPRDPFCIPHYEVGIIVKDRNERCKKSKEKQRKHKDQWTPTRSSVSTGGPVQLETTECSSTEDNPNDGDSHNAFPIPDYLTGVAPHYAFEADDGPCKGKAPVSPDPFSVYYTYDFEWTKGLLDRFEERINHSQ